MACIDGYMALPNENKTKKIPSHEDWQSNLMAVMQPQAMKPPVHRAGKTGSNVPGARKRSRFTPRFTPGAPRPPPPSPRALSKKKGVESESQDAQRGQVRPTPRKEAAGGIVGVARCQHRRRRISPEGVVGTTWR